MSDTRRIAKNTLMLYFRQILIMLVSLYTVRVVLSVLGAEDYGIYNVVAGVVTMFGFLSGAMATASQRYFSYDLGKGNSEHLKTTFSVTFQIYVLLALVIVLLAETAGLWFVNHKLVIPAERMTAVNWIFQAAVVSFLLTLITTPYMACIIAHENMNVYAYVSIVEVALKLGIVFLLRVLPYDKLIVYGVLLAAVALINTSIYRFYCRKHYAECKVKFVKDRALFKEIVSYSGWNLFGAAVGVVKNQLVNIAINLFCGSAVNAARAVAMQITSAANSFSQNFSVAMNPNIIKLYAGDEKETFKRFTFKSMRLVYLLMLFLSLPLVFEMPGIIRLWLKNPPLHSVAFARLSLIDALICSISYPLGTAIQATGKIRAYQSVVGTVLLLNFPISYAALKAGMSPEWTFGIAIIISVVSLILRLIFMQTTVHIQVTGSAFVLNFLRMLVCTAVFVLFSLIYKFVVSCPLFLINLIAEYAIGVLFICLCGLSRDEISMAVKRISERRFR